MVEKNDNACGMYNTKSQIKFKTSMLQSSLCGYSDVYILVGGTITAPNTSAPANSNSRTNIRIQGFASVTDYISEILHI